MFVFQFRNNAETSLRLRQERLKRNENIEKKVNEMKAKLLEQSHSSASPNSILKFLTKYRNTFLIGLFALLTGSVLFYKFNTNNDRTY
jgi:hypothetical protein